MALVVQKFGGSSVADPEKIRNVARRVTESAPGNQLVVVVSAMGKTTDGLVGLAHQLAPAPDPRELDMLLATAARRWPAACRARAGRGRGRAGARG